MKRIPSMLLLAACSLVPLNSNAQKLVPLPTSDPPIYYGVKVECMGTCNDVSLWDACEQASENTGLGIFFPVALSCDSSAARDYYPDTWFTCGKGKCNWFGTDVTNERVGTACADGSGRDAIVMCSDTSVGQQKTVRVECSGDCNDVTFNDACGINGSGWSPIGISCDDTNKGTGTAHNFSNGAVVYDHGTLSGSQKIGTYCKDGSGADALVQCTSSTLRKTHAVTVECMDDCAHLTIPDICNKVNSKQAIQVSCDTTSGSGTPDNPCGSSVGGSECVPAKLNLKDSERSLSVFCVDGSGADGIVMCLDS